MLESESEFRNSFLVKKSEEILRREEKRREEKRREEKRREEKRREEKRRENVKRSCHPQGSIEDRMRQEIRAK